MASNTEEAEHAAQLDIAGAPPGMSFVGGIFGDAIRKRGQDLLRGLQQGSGTGQAKTGTVPAEAGAM